jgi:addiction module HigA family antidote
MIRSWRNSLTRKVWEGERPNQFRGLDFEVAIDLLLAWNVAKALTDLSPLKSVGLHKLKGERKSQWAMSVNARRRICFEFRKGDAYEVEIVDYHKGQKVMPPAVHPGRLLKRELTARELSANRLALDIGVPSGRITDILNNRRSITADTAVRLGRYFGNSAQFWLDLQSQYDIAVVEREHGVEIIRRVRPADTA